MRSRVDQLVLARRIIFLVVLLVLAIPYGQIARAEEVIYNFKITATNPTNGENSVPTNLKDGNCQNQYCALMVGLGNSDKSPMGHGYPFLVPDSINTSTIQITGSNNPSQIKVMGESEGGGDDSFYHSNALFLFNSLGNLYYLEPNSTYSVTFKGGTSGVKAQYDYGEYFAYLDQDYTFSFTTGNGPSRTNEDYPTLTARPTLTPSVSLKNDSVEVRLTSTPIPMLIDKKDNIPTTSKLTVTSSASPTISIPAKKEDDITVTSDDFKSSSKITFWQRIKNYWTNFINKLFKKTKKKEVTIKNIAPAPSVIQGTPTLIPANTIAPLPTKKPLPTINTKPLSIINENVLKNEFGISDLGVIASILDSSEQLEKYEREYYQKNKKWPKQESTNQKLRIFIPSINATKTCQGSNVVEVKNASIGVDNAKVKRDECFRNGGEKKEGMSLDEQIASFQKGCYQKDYSVAKDTLDELLSKYCR